MRFSEWLKNKNEARIETPGMGGEPELPTTDYSKNYKASKMKLAGKPVTDPEYSAREGLEGPFKFASGKVLYYDPMEGKYYDAGSDIYIGNNEMMRHVFPRK